MSRSRCAVFATPILLLAGCARPSSLSRATLAAADPAAAESAFAPPANVFETDPPGSHRRELPARGDADHSGHGAPTPPPFAEPEPTPAATPARTPRPEKTPVDAAKPAEYVCPMHPDVRDSKPGVCPKCGMQLEIVAPKKPSPTATPRQSPAPSPTPDGHEHHHGSDS